VDNPACIPLSRFRHILISTGCHRPDNPGVFVGQSDCGLVETTSLDQTFEPQAQGITFIAAVFQHRPCTVNQQGPQRPIAAFADAEQDLLVAATVLAGHHTQAGRVIATRLIALTVADIRCG